jgi:hypothetical protein
MRRYSYLLKCGLPLWLSLLMLGCGATVGSGGGNGSNPSGPPPIPSIQTQISLDSAVPSNVMGMISQIISPLGTGSIGGTAPLPATVTTGDESVLIATDANEDIVLAAMANSPSTKLSANSTALALVRLALGVLSSSVSPAQVDSEIQATAEFPNLVSVISQALTAGTPPGTSTTVVQSVANVLSQLPGAAAPATAAASNSHAPALVNPTATSGAPFTVLNNIFTMQVTGADGSGGVLVVNNFPIQWTAASYTADGHSTPLTPTPPSGNIQLVGRKVGFTSLFTSNTPASVPGNGEAFDLAISQTSDSQAANLVSIGVDVTGLGLSLAGLKLPSTCLTSGVGTVLKASPQWGAYVSSPTWDNAWTTIKAIITVDGVTKIVSGCYTGAVPVQIALIAQIVSKWAAQFINTAYGLYKVATLTTAALSLAAEIAYANIYWNQYWPIPTPPSTPPFPPIQAGICETANVLVNCPGSLDVSLPSQSVLINQTTIAVGSTVQLDVAAYTGTSPTAPNSVPTILPANLQWQPVASDGIADVSQSGLVTGVAAGESFIDVYDSYADLSSNTFTVTVVPAITATADTTGQDLTVGTAITPFDVLTVTAGVGPYTCSVISGSLPSGLSLQATSNGCEVSGTPTASYSTGSVTFSVSDAYGNVATSTSTVSFTVANNQSQYWAGMLTSCTEMPVGFYPPGSCEWAMPFNVVPANSYISYATAGATNRDVVIEVCEYTFTGPWCAEGLYPNAFSASDSSFTCTGTDPSTLTVTVDPTQTTPTSMGGTWTATDPIWTKIGLGSDVAAGTWAATLVNGTKPAPTMNGYPVCESVCNASTATNCGLSPTGLIPNACVYKGH